MPETTSPQAGLPTSPTPHDVAGLLAREEVVARVTALFLATDRKDWPAVEACFAPAVHFDMSSVGGVPAATARAGDIAAGWRTGLAAVEQVHHQAGNFVVRVAGDRAEAFCYGIAYHFRARRDGRNTRVFVGSYDFTLARDDGAAPPWRITAMRFALKFLDGNPALEAAE
jgi:hypothetical protein